MVIKSCVFLCREDGSFKHISRRAWLQLVAGKSLLPDNSAPQSFLQVEFSESLPSCKVSQRSHASVNFTRWEVQGAGVARCSGTFTAKAACRETLAALMHGQVAGTGEASVQLQSSLQNYIGSLLDAGAQPSPRLNRVA